MTCLLLFHLCPATGFPAVHSLLSILLSIEWKQFCWLFLAGPPTVVFKELPLSSSLPRAGFLFPLIFSSTSSASLCAPLGSTYDNFLFLQLSPFPSLLFFSLLPLLSFYSNHTPVILFTFSFINTSPLLLSLTPPHPFFFSSSNPRQVFRRCPSSTCPLLLLSPAPSSSFLFAPNQSKLMPTASHLLCRYPSCCCCCAPIISAEEAANYIWRLHQPAPQSPTPRSQTDGQWTLTSHVSRNLPAKPTRRL